ncbi:MAG: helix-turn-helix domain-containing protein [Clostridia bacterium]|nr:helix-turn-helix domain-containing protein [Clostridia bacterium]
MKSKLLRIVTELEQKTGIHADVYSVTGELLTERREKPTYEYVSHPFSEFKQGVYLDEENSLTYFLIGVVSETYVAVIMGANDTTRNYAIMLSALIENDLTVANDNLSRADGVKSILLGRMTRAQIDYLIARYQIPPVGIFVLAISCDKDVEAEVFNLLTHYSEYEQDSPIIMEEKTIAYVSFMLSDGDYQSALDLAEQLYATILQELGIKVNIGVGSMAKSLYDLASSYSQSLSALRMGIQTNSKTPIHSYKEYIMIRMIEDIPDEVLQQYLDVLLDSTAKDILSDAEMMNTAEEFLNNSLNISETSRHLYMHRNTLMYRLDKIERAMGLNIRRFSDAVTFRIIMVLYKHLHG